MKTKIFFSADDDLVDICYDNVFKAVFTRDTPQSREAFSRLVSALIGRRVSITDILANEPPTDSTRDRQIRFDINCRAENGELIDVEMSLSPDQFEPVRMEFHVAKLFTGQDIRGKDKTYNDLKLSYQIAILVKKNVIRDKVFFHTFEYYDPDNRVSLNGRTRIITLELSKLEKIVEKPANEMSVQELWAVYLRYLTDRQKRSKINDIVSHEEGIAMASEVLMTVSQDEQERWWQIHREKRELDYQSDMVSAKQDGIEIGDKRGEEKHRKYVLDLIAQGLSIEEVKQLLEQAR
jgi:predicted transposase/invertase (TIGR01784 family)